MKIIFAAVCFTIISFAIHNIGALIDMPVYKDPRFFNLWSKIMMPTAGALPIGFMLLSVLFGLINGFFFSYAYALFSGGISGGIWQKGMKFGMIVFLLSGFGAFLSMVLTLNFPFILNISWMIQGLLTYLISGITAAIILKK